MLFYTPLFAVICDCKQKPNEEAELAPNLNFTMTNETSPSAQPIRARRQIGRRTSMAAAALRRNSCKFWDNALSELAVGQMSIYDFDPNNSKPMTFCEEMVHSPTTPMVIRDAVIFQPSNQPKQAIIDGEVWPPIFQAEKVRSAKTMQPFPTDVFVCTYPKCGTTWVQHICSQLMMNEYGPEEGQELCKTSPMIEKMGADYVNALRHPRLLKTHFSYYNCPKNSKAKYIFAVRNPKDCLVSYYFHNRNFKIYNWADGDFDVFFELFASGQLAFGDYFDHLLSWLPHINDKNILFLTYEEMFENLDEAIQKIGHFIGGNAADMVDDSVQLEKIVNESHIDAMKKNQSRWFPGNHLRQENFIRKGGSRDWKNYMNREQSDRLDAIFRTRMAGTIAEDWWQYEMAWDDEVEEVAININSEDEVESDSEDFRSVSRSSVYTPTPYMPTRRDSMDSLASSGFGSEWSVAINRRG
ncbi:Sulfotransfer-1 domain-containing protein [Aphelenchoides besseyi]|nr:Sulfotransfer-1 domain-containing protein [Aphelenchoides besseyi]KAI6200029.1 Sulfotransfer-1 domain-containing protein [Aphelenchoides besseyi]